MAWPERSLSRFSESWSHCIFQTGADEGREEQKPLGFWVLSVVKRMIVLHSGILPINGETWKMMWLHGKP
jgi:hypothetical protein